MSALRVALVLTYLRFEYAGRAMLRRLAGHLYGARHLIIGTILCFGIAHCAHAAEVQTFTRKDGAVLVIVTGTVTSSPYIATF